MRLCFSLILIVVFAVCRAQDKPFELALGWKGGGNSNPIHVNSISNEANDLHAVVVNNNSQMKILCFNNSMELVKESQAETLKEETLLGGYIKDGKAFLFFKNDKSDNIRSFVFGLQDNNVQEYNIPIDMDDKKYLGQLNTGNSFLYITAGKKEPVITVFDFRTEGHADKLDFNLGRDDLKTGFNKNDLWKALSKKSSGFSRSVDAAVVFPDIECDVDIANSPNKLYGRDDSLLLIMDREPMKTQVFAMNLKDKSLGYTVVGRNTNQGGDTDNSSGKFNSFLLGNNLYYVFASSDKLLVSISDFASHTELARYEAGADSQIDFKNTPVMQEGGGTIFSQKTERQLDKTKQLLRKMVSGRALITAIHTSGNTDELTIGAFKEMKSTSSGFMPGFGPGMIGVAGAGVAVGTGMYIGPSYTASWNRVTRFKMLVDRNNGKHVTGDVSPSVNEQIEEYSKDVKIPAGGSSLFKTAGTFRYAYYDRNEKKLLIVNFRP